MSLNNLQIQIEAVIGNIKKLEQDIIKVGDKPLDIRIDVESIRNQLKSVISDFSGNITKNLTYGKGTGITETEVWSGKSGGEKFKGTITTINYQKIINDLLKKEEQQKKRNLALEKEKLKALQKQKLDLEKQEDVYEKISMRLKNLGDSGVISSKSVKDFSNQLQGIRNSDATLKEKNKQFSVLNQNISDSKKQMMGFGEMLKIAYQKFAIWSIATVTWYALVRALKDVVKQVVDLDKAFTDIQMVVQSTNEDLIKMKNTYIDMAKEIGATVSDVTNAANDYLRAGKTIEETNTLIKNSLIFSKIANIESADATTYLISIMNAYKIAVDDVIDIVDKLSAVDVAAAVTSEGLAIALSKTASSANLAGVTLDELLGYIAAVKEVSQEADETIGNFFKTLFARMQQVKIGSLVDEDGEDISNTMTVLKQYGISILDAENNLRDMSVVLDELSLKWKYLSNAQQSEIATTLAGVRQRDRLLILMSNYNRAIELTSESLESQGSAMNKYGIYTQSIEAQLNSLNSSWTELADTTLNSDFIKFFISFGNVLITTLNNTGGLASALWLLIPAILTLKSTKIIGFFAEFTSWLHLTEKGMIGLTLKTNTLLISTTALKIALASATAVIGIAMWAIGAYQQSQEEARIETEKYTTSIKENISALEELKQEYLSLYNKTDQSNSDKEKLLDITKQLSEAYGVEADALSKLNGTYQEQSEVFDRVIYEEYEALNRTQRRAYEDALEEMKNTSNIAFGFAPYIGTTDKHKIKKELENLGYEGSYDYSASPLKFDNLEEELKYYEDLYSILEKIGVETYALDYVSRQITDLNNVIKENQAIIKEYESREEYMRWLDTSESEILNFKDTLTSFNQATLNEQKEMLDGIRENLDSLLLKYPEWEEYILKISDAFIEQEDILKTTDYILDDITSQLNIFKKLQDERKKELETQEKLLAIEKAREELAKAKLKRTLIYRAGVGFVYEEDSSEVEKAQENLNTAIANAGQDDLSLAISNVELLQDMYNQGLLDNSEQLRKYFLDIENYNNFMNSTFEDKLNILEGFITNKSWNDTDDDANYSGYIPTTSSNIPNLSSGAVSGVINIKEWKDLINSQKPNSQSNITIGSITLPNVNDVDGFINEITKVSRYTYSRSVK